MRMPLLSAGFVLFEVSVWIACSSSMSGIYVRRCRPTLLTTTRDNRIRGWISSVLFHSNRFYTRIPFSDATFSAAFCTIIIVKPRKRIRLQDAKNEAYLNFSTVWAYALGWMRAAL